MRSEKESARLLKQWAEDCRYWRGKVLTGEKAHWCPEWDDLPVDETCREFKACNCFDERPIKGRIEREKA